MLHLWSAVCLGRLLPYQTRVFHVPVPIDSSKVEDNCRGEEEEEEADYRPVEEGEEAEEAEEGEEVRRVDEEEEVVVQRRQPERWRELR